MIFFEGFYFCGGGMLWNEVWDLCVVSCMWGCFYVVLFDFVLDLDIG